MCRALIWWGRRQGWRPMESNVAANSWRRTKKIAAWPLLATLEWCRSHPAIIGGVFFMTTEGKKKLIWILQIYLQVYIPYVPICAGYEVQHHVLWQTVCSWGYCLRRNQQFPAAPRHMLIDDHKKKKANESIITEYLSGRWVRWGTIWCHRGQGLELSLSDDYMNALRTLMFVSVLSGEPLTLAAR